MPAAACIWHLFGLAHYWMQIRESWNWNMFLKWFFKRLSRERQAEFMKRCGIVLGTRNKNGRKSYLYMVNNLFAEILYENDNPRMEAQSVVLIDGLNHLNNYLEQEIRSRGVADVRIKNYW